LSSSTHRSASPVPPDPPRPIYGYQQFYFTTNLIPRESDHRQSISARNRLAMSFIRQTQEILRTGFDRREKSPTPYFYVLRPGDFSTFGLEMT